MYLIGDDGSIETPKREKTRQTPSKTSTSIYTNKRDKCHKKKNIKETSNTQETPSSIKKEHNTTTTHILNSIIPSSNTIKKSSRTRNYNKNNNQNQSNNLKKNHDNDSDYLIKIIESVIKNELKKRALVK
jgi:hypothetical protein